MVFDSDIHHRRSIRLKGYDYAQEGGYFVTVCTQGRECLFGNVTNGEMKLNEYGEIVRDEWLCTSKIRPYVQMDSFIVMPNHFHGIIILQNYRRGDPVGRPYLSEHKNINDTRENVEKQESTMAPKLGATHRIAPTIQSGTIGAIMGQFKSMVTKRINVLRQTPKSPIWQRNYHEHIIRDENDANRIREYIANNPINWDEDENNPVNLI